MPFEPDAIPDFNFLTAQVMTDYHAAEPGEARREVVANALRRVWNARALADLQVLDHNLSGTMGHEAAMPHVRNVERAIRSLNVAEESPV